MKEWLGQLISWYLTQLNDGGYLLVALLMAVESSFVPLPSELVIPPAAHLAHTTGRFSLFGLVVAGALGSWVGASLMYWGSRWAGRPLLMRYGRYLLISPGKIEAAERWAASYGPVGVLISRLLPVVRHLIGVPAGVVRMSFLRYSIFTLLGSAVWTGVLCWLGVAAGADERLLKGELHRVTLWVLGVVGFLGVVYYLFVHRAMKRRG